MAGSSDPDENPVGMNVVAMVDIIFCLCVFFMCSFRFKQLEGKFDSWLPKNKGNSGAMAATPVEIRIAMFWDPQREKTTRRYGHRDIQSDDELTALIKGAFEDFKNMNKTDVPVIIDGDARIPWTEVINVINICKTLQIDKIEFALGAMDRPQ